MQPIHESIAVIGPWRPPSQKVVADIKDYVAQALNKGHTLITAGMLGISYEATAEAIRLGAQPEQLVVMLPCSLSNYIKHYRQAGIRSVFSPEASDKLIAQMEAVQTSHTLRELTTTEPLGELTYSARNTAMLEAATALTAFQVNSSIMVQTIIDEAQARNLPVNLKIYS